MTIRTTATHLACLCTVLTAAPERPQLAGKLWLTAEGAKIVGSYDPAAKEVEWCS